jgi:hypothetical protein
MSASSIYVIIGKDGKGPEIYVVYVNIYSEVNTIKQTCWSVKSREGEESVLNAAVNAEPSAAEIKWSACDFLRR